MTVKRFDFNLIFGEDEHKGTVFDNGKVLKTIDVVYLLNELSKENGWLKKSIKRQQSSNEECSKYIEGVVKENEQLKSTNMEMEDYLGRLEERIIKLEKENTGDEKMMDYQKEYLSLVKKYEKLHDKLYKKDFFEVEPADEYTEDSRTFKNGLCVYNNRLGMAYSVTEIVEVLNSLVEYKDLISELFDKKIEALENDLERAIHAGMPTSILYEELDELEALKEEVLSLWYR